MSSAGAAGAAAGAGGGEARPRAAAAAAAAAALEPPPWRAPGCAAAADKAGFMWAHVRGFPWWPAQAVSGAAEAALACQHPRRAAAGADVLVRARLRAPRHVCVFACAASISARRGARARQLARVPWASLSRAFGKNSH
jgi:hypothetical protein